MVRSFSLTITRHCQRTEYTRKTISANENKIRICLVRLEQRLDNVNRKYVECLQTNMRAQYRRYKHQYKPHIKQGTFQDSYVHP